MIECRFVIEEDSALEKNLKSIVLLNGFKAEVVNDGLSPSFAT